jgi:flagellar L-ring protein precursor FlgH
MARERWFAVAVLVAGIAATNVAWAGEGSDSKKPTSASYQELYARYLESARVTRSAPATVARDNWMTELAIDPRARHVNDLLTVRVVESMEAVVTADAQLTKCSAGRASVTGLFGIENKTPDWLDNTNLVNGTFDTKFKGGGSTTRSGSLTANMTVRVVEVLPNGDLVLEGAREIDINGDLQLVVLTGVVRQADVDRNNIVPSTRIGQLQIQYFGRGLMKDNLRPGFLIRALNWIF